MYIERLSFASRPIEEWKRSVEGEEREEERICDTREVDPHFFRNSRRIVVIIIISIIITRIIYHRRRRFRFMRKGYARKKNGSWRRSRVDNPVSSVRTY